MNLPNLLRPAILAASLVVCPIVAHAQLPQAAGGGQANDIDALMARVLENREQAWRQLHEFVLDERERVKVTGPAGLPLHGSDREFTWYVRDGYFVRSPVRANGVAIGDDDRQRYEARWLEKEKRRGVRLGSAADGAGEAGATATADDEGDDADGLVKRGEPRFVSEAYFLRFKFEPGNYYFAGREALDGREVLRIEYYPTRLFSDDRVDRRPTAKATPEKTGAKRTDDDEDDFNREFNKVSLVTLWVDPLASQVVKYTFDNVGFGFLPGRSIVRVDEVRASMTMGRFFDDVWLPREIEMRGSLVLASGTVAFTYGRTFSDYRRAETTATIRGYRPGGL